MTIRQFEELVLRNLSANNVDFKIDGREILGYAQLELNDIVDKLKSVGKQISPSLYVNYNVTFNNGVAYLPIVNIGSASIQNIEANNVVSVVENKEQFKAFKEFAEDFLAYVDNGTIYSDYSGTAVVSMYPNLLEIEDDFEMIGQEYLAFISQRLVERFKLKLSLPEDKVND